MVAFLRRFQKISAKTKISLFALLLVILPSGFLAYRGYRSIGDREIRLKDNYRGLARLIRDKLEGDIKSLEENLIREIEANDWNQDLGTIQSQLIQILEKSPLIRDIFLVDRQGSIVHADFYLISPSLVQPGADAAQILNSDLVSTGERYEYADNNYSQAIFSYTEALEQASSPEAKAYIRLLIARCYLKMKRFTQAVENYRFLAESSADMRSAEGTPLEIIGLSQLAECFYILGQTQNQCRTLFSLYEELISMPYSFESYELYLINAKDSLAVLSQQPDWGDEQRLQLDSLNEKESKIQTAVLFLESARVVAMDQMKTDASFARELIRLDDEKSVQISFLALRSSDSQALDYQCVFEIDEDFVLTDVLSEIGKEESTDGVIKLGIYGKEESFFSPDETPVPEYSLASESLVQFFPWWRLVLFDSKGKTVEQIIRREKRLYGGALFGIFILIIMGAGLTFRAAIHEAEAARIKAEFVSNVSHELKTPLALIRLFGETLEMQDIPDKKKREKFSRVIARESQRLSHLVDNVLDFSRIDAGKKEYNFERADITQVVSHTVEAYRYYLKDQDFEFVAAVPDEPILIWGDKDAISQALLNLVSNAEKFSKEKKYIGIEIVRKKDEVWICVEDKGPGIPASSLKQIFDKFDRGVGDVSRDVQGSGLGLTITRHIVEGHGGVIAVESRMGEGSRFTIKLPLNSDRHKSVRR